MNANNKTFRLDHLVRAFMGAAVLGLTACTGMPIGGGEPIPPRGRYMEEMRNSMGLPNAIRFSESGEEVWEYSDRRVGFAAYFVTFAPDGRVSEMKRLRTEESVAQIIPDTTTAPQVTQLLGEPAGVRFNGNDPVWQYRLPAGRALQVEFGAGRVVKRVSPLP